MPKKELPEWCLSKNGCNLWENKTTISCGTCGMNKNYSPVVKQEVKK